jgi:thiosulfate dehydrogenase [quinone] large subunit
MLKTQIRAVTASWRSQSPSIRVIRLWLGVTWIYGGWNKATDSAFLGKVGATSISNQLTGYSHNSPLGFLFRHLIERATLVGIFVMLAEFALGLATLFWIAPTFAAFSGFAMSLGLWSAATWHVKPYFLGSDTAYAVLWLAYFLSLLGKRRHIDISLDRRGALRVGALGTVAALAAVAGRLFQKSSPVTAPAAARGIIKVAELPIGKTHEFSTPAGLPAILFRTKHGVFAYSEICTHQGCTVAYSPMDKILICPCHQGAYDPFDGARVLSGPPPLPLPKIRVAIEGNWIVLV